MENEIQEIKNQILDFAKRNEKRKYEPKIWEDFLLTEESYKLFFSLSDRLSLLRKTIKSGIYTDSIFYSIFKTAICLYPSLSRIILSSKNKEDSKMKYWMIANGLYKGDILDLLDTFDSVALSCYVEICDLSELEKFKKNKYEAVRYIVFERLGMIQNWESIVKDRSSRLRKRLCLALPFHHHAFQKMIGEKSKNVFLIVAEKIEESFLPILLTNKLSKEEDIKKIIDKRIGKK